jgi:hypothetical protein
MTVRSKDGLTSTIGARIPDNNAGLISASDVRNSMLDIVDSINQVVASGNFNSETPFVNPTRFKSMVYMESGVNFPNGGGTQYVPYPGPSGISHNNLSNLDVGDPHAQYLPTNGTRRMTNNFGLGQYWINSSGSADPSSTGRGLRFAFTASPSDEEAQVGSGTSFRFLRDNSRLNSARGAAKAWINFDASGSMVVRDAYNVSGIQRLDAGKFKIIFNSGVFANNNYVAIGSSNSTSSSGSREDFSNNTVGIVLREGNDASALRSLTFVVRDDGGQYVNAKMNDLVVFGTEPNGVSPTVNIIP